MDYEFDKHFYEEKGIKNGIEIGRIEALNEVAKNLKAKGADDKTIAECMGICVSDLQNCIMQDSD